MPVDREFQVLIVGTTTVGLSAAGFLRQAGLDPVVVGTDEPTHVHAPIELSPEAMAVLSGLDVADRVRQTATGLRGSVQRCSDGSVERRRSADGSARLFALERESLRDLLASRLPNRCLRSETTVSTVEDAPDGVTVEFENGVTERFDAVLGADGINSQTRDVLNGTTPEAMGTTSVSFPLSAPPTEDELVEQWWADGRVLVVSPADDRVWGTLTVPSDRISSGSPPMEIIEDTLSEASWLPDASRLHAADVTVGPDYRVEPATITGDRVALLGDAAHAAHCVSGLGPQLALEDAAVLTAALTTDGDPLPARLTAYGARRCSRLAAIRDSATAPDSQGSIESTVSGELADVASLRRDWLEDTFSPA